jgi:predicted acetyltransferase
VIASDVEDAKNFCSESPVFETGSTLEVREVPKEDPGTHDVAEFFVLRQYRRLGVGRRAAHLLWKHLPGNWTVRVSQGNRGALDFWRHAVARATNGTATEIERPGMPNAWLVFGFEIIPGCIARLTHAPEANPEEDCG